MLQIGRISFANCTPIFHALSWLDTADPREYNFTEGPPAQLNSLLAEGRIDVCPSSSFQYTVHPGKYLLIPGLSISSVGPVESVLLFSRRPIESLDGNEILLTSESSTSVNLLKILMARRFGCKCSYAVTDELFPGPLDRAPALLLIGNSAMKAAKLASGLHVYDMGELWYEWTGLPFVFALWFVHRNAVVLRCSEVYELAGRLVEAKRLALENLAIIAQSNADSGWISAEDLVSYWRRLSYDLDADHIEGLKLFFKYSTELGLAKFSPELHFLSDSSLDI